MRTWRRWVGAAVAAGVMVLIGPVPTALANDPAVAIEPGAVTVTNGSGEFMLVNQGVVAASVQLNGVVALNGTTWPLSFVATGQPNGNSSIITIQPHDTVLVTARAAHRQGRQG